MATKKKPITSELLAFSDGIGKLRDKITPIEDTLVSYMFWNLSKSKVLEILSFLTEDVFTSDFSKDVYSAMTRSIVEKTDPTVYIVKKDMAYLAKLHDIHYNRELINIDDQIKHILDTKKIIEASYLMQKVIDNEMQMSEMVNTMTSWKSSFIEKTNDELADDFFARIESMSTGYKILDDITGGVGIGHLWLIAGYTSVGKTMFLTSLLHNLASAGKNCVFFSLEMTNKDIFGRLVAKDSGVNTREVIRDQGHKNADKVRESIKRVRKLPFRIYQNKRGLDEIIMEITRLSATEKVDCIFVDYAQLISTPMRISEYDSMTRVAQKLQDFCKTTNISLIILSQISNESAKNPDDKMISAKGGGSLPASADVAIEIYSKMTADEIAECNSNNNPYKAFVRVKKNRHGRTGKVKMDSFAYRSCFEESEDQTDNEENISKIGSDDKW